MNHEIDVLICAYNEAPYIPQLLASLRMQSVPLHIFRVIFVDNASTDDTRQIIEANAQGLNLEYIYEGRLGKNWACNSGYSRAQSTYVAHIDGDAKAAPNWIENILRVINDRQPDLFGGPHFPYYIGPKPAWFKDSYNCGAMGANPRYLEKHEYLHGVNMVWRRSIIIELGGFKTGVGTTGRGHARGDETELMVRAYRQLPDFKAFYDPGIIVYHVTRPESYSIRYWIHRTFVQGRRSTDVWGLDAQRASLARVLVTGPENLFLLALGFVRASCFRDRIQYPYIQNYLFERILPHFYALGEVYSQIGALFHPRGPETWS